MPTTRPTPAPARSGHPLLDGGPDVLGPVGDDEPPRGPGLEDGGQPLDLRPRPLAQGRRAPDGPVPADQLVEELRGRGPTPADGGVERLDPLGRRRCAVGHHQHADRVAHAGDLHAGPSLGVDQGRHLLEDARVGLRQDAVAQVEDVAGLAAGGPQHPAGLRRGHLPGAQAQGGIEVALHGEARPHPAPGLVEGHPPVDPDDGAAGRGHRGQQLAGAHAEEDGGHAGMGVGQLGEEPAGGRQHQLAVVVRRQDAGPAVEDLDGGGPGVQLGSQRGQGQVGEALHQLVPDSRGRRA